MSDDELRDLLSAHLDGELDATEEAEVRGLLERSATARDELEGLARVRLMIRDLTEVDPPAGFLEGLSEAGLEASAASIGTDGARAASGPIDLGAVREAKKRRLLWPKISAAVVGAAAAVVLVLGLTPVTDKVVPPVNAYAERHLSMMEPPAPVGGPGGPGGTTSTTGGVASPVADPSGFAPVAATELDQAGAPARLDTGYDRMGGYHNAAGVMHVMYEKSDRVISIYLQRGRVSWDALPAQGKMATVDSVTAWEMDGPADDVMIVERGSMVYTIVAVNSHDGMIDVLQAMPAAPAPSMMDEVRQTCRSIVEGVGLAR